MDNFLETESLIISLLLVVSLVAIVVRRLRIPYTVALVIVGLLFTFQQPLKLTLTPELILSLFVPPLVFEAAFHIELKILRENWLPILALAVPGVLLTTGLVALIVTFGIGLSLTSGLVFGALIAATDPVAVVALFRTIGAPKRLTTLVESESLFNDGTAIVIFQLMLAIGLTTAATVGNSNRESFDLLSASVSFIRVSAGGIGIGIGLGWLAAQIIGRVDDYLIETTLTTTLAFGSYLLAEQFHTSGVLAVVAAGIVTGNFGLTKMSPTTKIVLINFWEYLAFVANSLVFLLIGLDVNIREISANWFSIAVALGAVLISRAVVVYGLTNLTNLMRGTLVSAAYQHVMFWGGLRGAISLALALSLPAAFADRELLRVMTFGVVLFTLLAQGTTMQVLLKRLGLVQQDAVEIEYERRYGRLLASRAALERLEKLHQEGVISALVWEEIEPKLRDQVEDNLESQRQLLAAYPQLRSEELNDARIEGLRAQRAAITIMLSNGLISETVHDELIAEVDAALTQKVELSADAQEVKRTTAAN